MPPQAPRRSSQVKDGLCPQLGPSPPIALQQLAFNVDLGAAGGRCWHPVSLLSAHVVRRASSQHGVLHLIISPAQLFLSESPF